MMWKQLRRQIVITALLTTPLIALLAVVPIYTVRERLFNSFPVVWFLISMLTAFSWCINVIIINTIKKSWAKTGVRILLSSAFMMIMGGVILYLIRFKISFANLSMTQLNTLRVNYIFSINLIVYILLDLIFTKESQLRLNNENAELKFTNLEAEYKLLKEQVSPHFLFNALSISKSMIKDNPDEAGKYIKQLSDFLRMTIENNHKTASLKSELELTENYIGLQKLRFGDTLCFSKTVEEEKEQMQLPFFTIVSLIENAIKHNNFTDKKPLMIDIYTQYDFVVVKNNVQPKLVVDSSKKGLANINQRSVLLSGNEIEVINNKEDFLVKIKLITE